MNVLLLWHSTETGHSAILVKGQMMLMVFGMLTAR